VEDIVVIGGIWAAVNHPWLFFVLMAIFFLLMIWLLPKMWRGIKMLAARIKALFTPRQATPPLT
jgi:protein-S-isoprenylcysteine O-methyltransferase Ste14